MGPWLQKPPLHLDQLLDTWVRSDLTHPPIFRGALQFLYYKIFTEMHRLGCTNLHNHSLASPTLGVGVPEQNVPQNLPGVDVVLHAKFQLCRSNGVAAYR